MHGTMKAARLHGFEREVLFGNALRSRADDDHERAGDGDNELMH